MKLPIISALGLVLLLSFASLLSSSSVALTATSGAKKDPDVTTANGIMSLIGGSTGGFNSIIQLITGGPG
jgi:hypothetical protein